MTYSLPLRAERLLGLGERVRLELKPGFDPDVQGPQVLAAICAFANDLLNNNGGYVVIGVDDVNGAAVRPARGLSDAELDVAQKWIRGRCARDFDPPYVPNMDVDELDGRRVLVVWASASDVRPHRAPGPRGENTFWVRIGNEVIDAQRQKAVLTRLLATTSRVPFDDRRAFDAEISDLRFAYVSEFLRDVDSDLRNESDSTRVYQQMQLLRRANGHEVPRNVALLFFADDPSRWFRGAKIEVARFSDPGGSALETQTFAGPIPHQVRRCLEWLDSIRTRYIVKNDARPEADAFWSYPPLALREAVVNAVYHRDYESAVEPTKVHVYADRIEVISYPGPVDEIELSDLEEGAPPRPAPARNRRIGELLREIRLGEARGTGIGKIRRAMRENGSPPAQFDFPATRSYFRVTLPIHADSGRVASAISKP